MIHKLTVPVVTLLVLNSFLFGQSVLEWKNPQVFGVNKLPARAHFFPYSSVEEAQQGDMISSPMYLSLNGKWKFNWVRKPVDRPNDFHEINYDVSGWNDINVPGNWELQGYGIPIYVKRYPFLPIAGRVPEDWNPVGSYRRDFEIPKMWEGRKVTLQFGAVRSAFYLWVNGKKVGYSQGCKLPAKFDVTDFVRIGGNTIAVEVYRWSDGTFLEDQDFWRLSGMDRDVFLYARRHVQIQDYFATPVLNEDLSIGTLNVSVDVQNYNSKMKSNYYIQAVLKKDGITFSKNKKVIFTKNKDSVFFSFDVPRPHLWSAETPHLYNLQIILKDQNEDILEVVQSRTGFRKVELRDGQLLVNGQPVILKGVNRHEHDGVSGHVISLASMRKDIELFQKGNISMRCVPVIIPMTRDGMNCVMNMGFML